jgi:methyl-accepting chemotaxis protein
MSMSSPGYIPPSPGRTTAGVPGAETAEAATVVLPFARSSSAAGRSDQVLVTGAERFIRSALRQAELDGVAGNNLFVADRDLNLVHVNARALAALHARDGELRRAFGLGAADLPGISLLRFHPAPTQLQALLGNRAALPYETLWSFGRVVWKARIGAVPDEVGGVQGFLVSWEDVSEQRRHAAAMQRVWALAEELPVPVMYPESGLEIWRGNPACVHALQRLAPFLPADFNPAAGIPIGILFPDSARRADIFSGPERLPHKERLTIGPETVAVLVSAVRGQEQEYLGPQITWEFITRLDGPAPVAPAAQQHAEADPEPPASPEPPAPAASLRTNPVAELRSHARRFEQAAEELVTLSRLLDAVADAAGGEGETNLTAVEPSEGAGGLAALARSGEEAARAAACAARIVGAAREAADVLGTADGESARLLRSLAALARETSLLALDATLTATRDGTEAELRGLAGEAGELRSQLGLRLESLVARAERAAGAVREASGLLERAAGMRESYPDELGAERLR